MSAERTYPGPILGLIGLVIAAYGAMCGIGGGLFAVPILHYVLRVPLKQAVATSLCLVFASALSATAGEMLHPAGALYPPLVLVLVPTALLGTQLGFYVAQRIETRYLKLLFCVVLTFVGLRLFIASGTADSVGSAALEGFELTAGHLVRVAGFGIFAGMAAPLLGVGGGLVLVPTLLFGLSEIGYLGARSTSMAVAAVTSARSVWLYHGRGLIDWRTARWFAGGALIGAIFGVYLVHLHGAAEIGQILLGVALLFAAMRFGWDFRRTLREAPSGVVKDQA